MAIDTGNQTEEKENIQDVKKKRSFKSYAWLVLILIVAIALFRLFHGTESPIIKEKKEIHGLFGKGGDVSKDMWVGAGEVRLKAVEEKNKELSQMIKNLTESLSDKDKEIKEIKSRKENIQEKYPVIPPPPIKSHQTGSLPPGGSPGSKEMKPLMPEDDQIGILTIKPQSSAVSADKRKLVNANAKKQVPWLPAGSFVKATLLTGLDAPTGADAQGRSVPVLLRVDDNTIGPNFSSFPLAQCFIVGSGWAAVSDERAYIRSETLSCVAPDGRSSELKVKGQVVGPDGKPGIRGHLVSKQGTLLMQSLLAGFAEGMGKAFRSAESTYTTTPLGGSQEVLTGSALRAGIYGGVSKSMEDLSKFFLDTARQTFPVIEIDSGIQVEFFLQEGKEVDII